MNTELNKELNMTESEIEESLVQLLDEIYEPFKMGELTFYPSDILKSCDPIAWRMAVSEHEDYLAEKLEEESADSNLLENLEDE